MSSSDSPAPAAPDAPAASAAPDDGGVAFVSKVAASLRTRLPRETDRRELISIGFLAYIKAKRARPDISDAGLFVRVRGAILDDLRNQDSLTRRQRKDIQAVAQARLHMRSELGRDPIIPELATRVGFSCARVDAACNTLDAESVLVDIENIPDESDEHTIPMDRLLDIHNAIASLKPSHAKVIQLTFLDGLTLKEAAQHLGGISSSRVGQIQSSALCCLRKIMSA